MKDALLGCVVLIFAAMSSDAQAAPIGLDATTQCSMGNQSYGIMIDDVLGDLGGATDCWGTFPGNASNLAADGFEIDGMQFDYVAKQNTPGSLEGANIGLVVSPSGGALSGTWAYDPALFSPEAFLIVLKAANDPGYAVWLFGDSDAASFSGDWSVAWDRDLSHLSIYAKDGVTVPEPSTLLLLGTGLAMVGVRYRRRKH